MERERLPEAIKLREEGRASQDEATLEKARTLLLELAQNFPGRCRDKFSDGGCPRQHGI